MGFMYAKINKETLSHICRNKKVTNQFIVSKVKVKPEKLEKWLHPSDDLFPTINQAKGTITDLPVGKYIVTELGWS